MDIVTRILLFYFQVFHVKNKTTNSESAVKRLNFQYRGVPDREEKIEEARLLELCQPHKNIIQLKNVWEEWDQLYIETELCALNLERIIADSTETATPAIVWNVFTDMVDAVKHIHSLDIVHNDIKPENIMLTRDGVAKLGDFGMAFDFTKIDTISFDGREGDSKYLAPEVVPRGPSKASDIFSLGLTIFQFATDFCPPSSAESDAWHNVRSADFMKTDMSESLREACNALEPMLRDLLVKMMHVDREERPTIDQIYDAIRKEKGTPLLSEIANMITTFMSNFLHIAADDTLNVSLYEDPDMNRNYTDDNLFKGESTQVLEQMNTLRRQSLAKKRTPIRVRMAPERSPAAKKIKMDCLRNRNFFLLDDPPQPSDQPIFS